MQIVPIFKLDDVRRCTFKCRPDAISSKPTPRQLVTADVSCQPQNYHGGEASSLYCARPSLAREWESFVSTGECMAFHAVNPRRDLRLTTRRCSILHVRCIEGIYLNSSGWLWGCAVLLTILCIGTFECSQRQQFFLSSVLWEAQSLEAQ